MARPISDFSSYRDSTVLKYLLFLVLVIGFLGCQQDPIDSSDSNYPPVSATTPKAKTTSEAPNPTNAQLANTPKELGRSLFDGKTLDGWQITNFGGEGDCYVENSTIVVEMGDPMSGINSTLKDLPKNNYEISLSAKRVDGIDFFCALTFPVEDSHCSFVVGGWAGAIVGLSNIDGKDASDNETKSVRKFENDQWYKIGIRVHNDNISAWIDDEQVVDLNTKGRKIDLRAETLACRPIGISSFQTTAAYKDVRIRRLEKTDVKSKE